MSGYQEYLDWSKTRKPSAAGTIVRKGNLSLLATTQFRNGQLVNTTKQRCIWPNPYQSDSNVLSRRVWGKEA